MRRLVLFDLDGTLVDHESAAAERVEQWLIGNGWAEAASIAGLVRDWDAIAERQFRAYRKRRTSSRGRLRELLPHIGRPLRLVGRALGRRLRDVSRCLPRRLGSFPDAVPDEPANIRN